MAVRCLRSGSRQIWYATHIEMRLNSAMRWRTLGANAGSLFQCWPANAHKFYAHLITVRRAYRDAP